MVKLFCIFYFEDLFASHYLFAYSAGSELIYILSFFQMIYRLLIIDLLVLRSWGEARISHLTTLVLIL